MKKKQIELKLRIPEESLNFLLLKRIESCKKENKEIIDFPTVFSKVASSFSIPKGKVWTLLYFLHDLNFIEIVFGHGIKLNYCLKDA